VDPDDVPDDPRAEVERLDDAWNRAYEQNRREALGSILADEFEASDAGFRLILKSQLMEPATLPRRIRFIERSIGVFGATAVTRGRLQLELESGRVDQRYFRVYTRRGTSWVAVAVQVFPVAADGAPEPAP